MVIIIIIVVVAAVVKEVVVIMAAVVVVVIVVAVVAVNCSCETVCVRSLSLFPTAIFGAHCACSLVLWRCF